MIVARQCKQVRKISPTGSTWTYGREGAIMPYLLYLLVRKGVILALPAVREGRKCEENAYTIVKIDLFPLCKHQ
jgi:hypothetical protein